MSEVKTNTIGKEFTMPQLIKFVAAPIFSKLVIALLSTLDDSLFIARYCSENALAAFSIAMPWFMLVDAFASLLCATGIKCSMLMGEKKNEEANRSFTTMTLITAGIGLIFTLILSFWRKPILIALKATDLLLPYALSYMNVSRFYTPLVLVSFLFQRFYVIAGKPKVAVFSTILSTICNFFFDWLFIVRLQTGIVGTAYANLISNILVTVIGLIFFSNQKREIHFTKPKGEPFKLLLGVAKLGKAQFLTSIALSINSYVSNAVLLKYGGEVCVAAYTIVGNIQFMMMNSYFGLMGSASPIVSYAYGEKNVKKLVRILKQIAILITGWGVCVLIMFTLLKQPAIELYMGSSENETLRAMVEYGLKVAPFALFIFGYNFMMQDLTIAVGNDKASAFLSAVENIVFSNISVIVIPMIFGIDGIWYGFLVTECATLLFSLYVAYANRDVYGYGPDGIATFIQN